MNATAESMRYEQKIYTTTRKSNALNSTARYTSNILLGIQSSNMLKTLKDFDLIIGSFQIEFSSN